MKRESFISKIRDLQDSSKVSHSEAFTSHFLIGVDLAENGAPGSSVTISHGRPFETVGMIDLLILNLQDIKKDILNKMSTKNQKAIRNGDASVESMLDELPSEVRSQLIDLKNRMESALKNGDIEELERLKNELRDFKNPFSNDDESNDSFNIDDFKGGL